jgi:hypothetical protein
MRNGIGDIVSQALKYRAGCDFLRVIDEQTKAAFFRQWVPGFT